jgi:hypothetical protein
MMMVRGERDTLSPGVHEDLYTMYLSEVYHSIINIIGIPHLGYPGYRVQYPRNTCKMETVVVHSKLKPQTTQ